MRIEGLDVEAFGRLTHFDGREGPLPGLVVVLGPNEAGKSTVFEFLTTMLYGFAPASRDLNPFVPWGADEARGALHLRLQDGRSATVTRRLRSQPAAQLELDGEITDLRNHPLPWVEHVPRRVFRQVFAVTLQELASLDDDTWARIQDRVVGSMGASDLRSIRAVADQLEKEAGELWRSNRRGNQKVREARERMRGLRARRREAADADRELRARVRDLESARSVLKARRERRAADQAVLERAQILLPIRTRLQRVAELRSFAGPAALLADLPADPHLRLLDLRAAVKRHEDALADLERERAEPEGLRDAVTDSKRTVLAHRDEIGRYAATASRASADRERMLDLDRDLTTLEGRLDRLCRELVGTPWREAPRDRLETLTASSLRAAAGRVERAHRRAEVEGAAPEPVHQGGLGTLAAAAAFVGGGVALALWGVTRGEGWLVALGAAAASGGLAQGWSLARARTAREAIAEERRRRLAEVDRDVREAEAAFRDLVRDTGLSPEHAERPEEKLADTLERFHELAEQHRARRATRQEARERLEAVLRDGRALAQRLSAPVDTATTPETLAASLSEALREAERAEQAAEAAVRELRSLHRRADTERQALEEARGQVAALEEAAARFGDGPADEILSGVAERLEALDHARRLEEELKRTHPDLPRLRQRIDQAEREGERWLVDETDLVTRRARVQELHQNIEELEGTTKSLETQIELARGRETADQVDGEIATLVAEVEAMVRARDRRWVLARLFREADRAFREEHQPDLMRRAGRNLAHLTGGRYDRILVEETADSDLFRIAGPEVAGPIPLKPPVSTGTLEQAYLSLRLAIVDHLDQGSEPLPLFIDEVFVNWDAARRARGVEVAASLAENRQVFVFTCHPFMAEELARVGARLIELPSR